MIIIPELRIVLILTPRTGTRALKRAVAAKYPDSIAIYRHMEADGVPQGYDMWPKYGVIREPIERLWSLYKYLKRFGIDYCQEHDDTYTRTMRESVNIPFEKWLIENEVVFTCPYDRAGFGRFYPQYAVRHPLPENKKSQFLYLRPDLGTEIIKYSEIDDLYSMLRIKPNRINESDSIPPPALSLTVRKHLAGFLFWDMEAARDGSSDALTNRIIRKVF